MPVRTEIEKTTVSSMESDFIREGFYKKILRKQELNARCKPET